MFRFPRASLFAVAVLAVLAWTGAAAQAAATTDEVRRIIIEESRETLVPTSLALAVAQVESGLRPDHQGADGARGVFQILPERAHDLGTEPRALWNARPNVKAGLKVLDGLLDRTEGRWDEALRAYASLRDGRPGHANRYVADVLGWERRFAERLAAQDAVDGRRREVLMGHDDWRSQEPETDMVGRDSLPAGEPEDRDWDDSEPEYAEDERDEPEETETAELPPYLHEERIDPSDDDDTDVEVRIYRGGGTDVEITVYEEEYEVSPPPAWRNAPRPPRIFHRPPPRKTWKRPKPFSKPFGWRSTRMSREFRGPRWSPRLARKLKRQARRKFGWRHRQ